MRQDVRHLRFAGFLMMVGALAMGPALARGESAPPPPHDGAGHDGSAHGGFDHGGRPHGGPMEILGVAGPALHDLTLTGDQRDKIHEIIRGYLEGELGAAVRDLEAAHRDLDLILWKLDVTDPQVDEGARLLADRIEPVARARRAMAAEVLAALPDDQRAAFEKALTTLPPGPPDHLHAHGPHGTHI